GRPRDRAGRPSLSRGSRERPGPGVRPGPVTGTSNGRTTWARDRIPDAWAPARTLVGGRSASRLQDPLPPPVGNGHPEEDEERRGGAAGQIAAGAAAAAGADAVVAVDLAAGLVIRTVAVAAHVVAAAGRGHLDLGLGALAGVDRHLHHLILVAVGRHGDPAGSDRNAGEQEGAVVAGHHALAAVQADARAGERRAAGDHDAGQLSGVARRPLARDVRRDVVV